MDINELLQEVNIVDYISQYVDLEQRGDEWWGLSCFKDEKTPSFSVREDPPVFYDYSSGIGGNLYTFIRYYHKCSNSDAFEILKKAAGVSENGSFRPASKLEVTKVCKRFVAPKKTTKASKTLVLPDNYMDRYEWRDDKLAVWRDEGISNESMKRFQVRYDAFSDRIVYPIRNVAGKIVNVGGRTLDPNWKEKGQRKYCYFFNWGQLDTIYGLAENMEYIREAGEIILFEGCKSVLIADSWCIRNTGAILTSHLNPQQMKLLAKIGVRVVFALDKDVDVSRDHNVQILKRYVNVTAIRDRDNLLQEKDAPVDQGLDIFQKLIGCAERL